MNKSELLTGHLYQLVAYAKAQGWADAQKWMMANMAREERAGRKKRKRKAYVVNSLTGKVTRSRNSEFWISPDRLRQSEEDGEGDD